MTFILRLRLQKARGVSVVRRKKNAEMGGEEKRREREERME